MVIDTNMIKEYEYAYYGKNLDYTSHITCKRDIFLPDKISKYMFDIAFGRGRENIIVYTAEDEIYEYKTIASNNKYLSVMYTRRNKDTNNYEVLGMHKFN